MTSWMLDDAAVKWRALIRWTR